MLLALAKMHWPQPLAGDRKGCVIRGVLGAGRRLEEKVVVIWDAGGISVGAGRAIHPGQMLSTVFARMPLWSRAQERRPASENPSLTKIFNFGGGDKSSGLQTQPIARK